MNTADILEKAADLIEPPGRWTQGFSARDGRGAPRESNDPDAVCWCASGAIARVTGDFLSAEAKAARGALFSLLGQRLSKFNDAPERTQAEVVAKLREAAALARETHP